MPFLFKINSKKSKNYRNFLKLQIIFWNVISLFAKFSSLDHKFNLLFLWHLLLKLKVFKIKIKTASRSRYFHSSLFSEK